MSELINGRFRKDLKYKAIIDKAISGDRVVSHIYFDDGSDVELVTLLAGIRTPRSSDPKNEVAGEPFGDEAKKYIETRLVKQKVWVQFLGVNSNDIPVVRVFHPAGNISEKIISAGLAYVPDWQLSLIGAKGMSSLRQLEKEAKLSGRGIWKSVAPKPTSGGSAHSSFKIGSTVDATITKVVSADTFNIELANGEQILVHLASIRAPRAGTPSEKFIAKAREFVRKYVGKKVKVLKEAERVTEKGAVPLVSITLPNGKNLAEVVVLNGFATVIRHRQGDNDRSFAWDSLMEAEAVAVKEKKGVHGKPPAEEKILDASTDANRARVHLRTLATRGRINGVVEFVISPNRIKVVLPRENLSIILVLAGLLSVPKESEFSGKALALNNKHVLQRDVQVELFDIDKVGGFIGNLYLPGTNLPYQVGLIQQGFVEVHDGSVRKTKFEDEFFDAEEEAQSKRIGIWTNWDPEEAERQFQEQDEKRQLKYEQKITKNKIPSAFDFDDDEEEDLSHLPESVRKLVISRSKR